MVAALHQGFPAIALFFGDVGIGTYYINYAPADLPRRSAGPRKAAFGEVDGPSAGQTHGLPGRAAASYDVSARASCLHLLGNRDAKQ
ncbi:MAG TPA: hypothetical protein VIJ34_14350 [Acidimicrobiales bacterium]